MNKQNTINFLKDEGLKYILPALVGPGKIWYVDGDGGVDDVFQGRSWDGPFNTLAYAFSGNFVAAGDTVLIAPGHTESVSSATGMALDIAGVTIIGLGSGTKRPTITLNTATTATIAVSANDISFYNCIFTANFADIVSVFTLTTAKNFKVEKCRVQQTATNMNFLYVFDTDATTDNAAGLTFTDSVWISPDAATVALCKVDGINSDWNVSRNYLSAAAQASGGSMFTIAANMYLANLVCLDNRCRFIGGDLSGAGVVFVVSGTGVASNTGVFSKN